MSVTRLSAIAVLSAAVFACTSTRASIVGFGDGTGYTLTGFNEDGSGNVTGPGAPTISGGVLTITTPDGSISRAAYYNTRQNAGTFSTSFIYRHDPSVLGPVGQADGFTLVLQNDPRGLAATGGAGAGLGYGVNTPITNSAAFQFYLRQGPAGAVKFETGGNIDFDNATPPGGINLVSGDAILVNIDYDGTTVTETLIDLSTPTTPYITSFAADIPTAVGGSFAYVGFTGGTGGGFSTQQISSFSFTAVPEPTAMALLPGAGLALSRRRR